jgi:hypothetical protein
VTSLGEVEAGDARVAAVSALLEVAVGALAAGVTSTDLQVLVDQRSGEIMVRRQGGRGEGLSEMRVAITHDEACELRVPGGSGKARWCRLWC